MTRSIRRLSGILVSGLLSAATLTAQTAPEIGSRAAILLDADSGRILFEKNADEVLPPASITKVVAIYVILEEASRGLVRLNAEVRLPPGTRAVDMPPRSSLMFLGEGQRVTLWELLEGMAVASGNDAAYAAAIHVAGSAAAFVDKMNAAVAELGLGGLRFTEPSGLSEYNQATARELAVFMRYYVQRHPEALRRLHSLKELAYPKPANHLPGYGGRPIVQRNLNSLLFNVPGVDGIKTGFIVESGFNSAVTAARDGMRLIAVTLGARTAGRIHGAVTRARDGERLLEYGFGNFVARTVPIAAKKYVRVWKGNKGRVLLEESGAVHAAVRRANADLVSVSTTVADSVVAPVPKGAVLGRITVLEAGVPVRVVDLRAAEAVDAGPWWRVAIDSVGLFVTRLFGGRSPGGAAVPARNLDKPTAS